MNLTTAQNLSDEQVRSYRENGFVCVRNIISKEEAAEFREAAWHTSRRMLADAGHAARPVFDQCVNVWREDEAMQRLTLHPNIAQVAAKLAGVPLRLWHDHILIKQPHNNVATEFHQDQPYWPHAQATNPISCWLALCDVPVERGCMTFLPGSHRHTELTAQNLTDARSLFNLCPELAWQERITVPLRAGDCTFHHGRCAHMATPNDTDEPRVAHIIIYMDENTIYDGKRHVVTDPLGLTVGQPISGELFPRVADFAP